MNIAKFKKLEEVVNEFNMCWAEATRAEQTAREIIAAVQARIENDKNTTAKRVAYLQSKIKDMGNSETVRRVASMELKAIESKSYGITAEEREAIETEINKGRAAMADARKIKVREVLQEAEEEIKVARKECLGRDFVLLERGIESQENELLKMQE